LLADWYPMCIFSVSVLTHDGGAFDQEGMIEPYLLHVIAPLWRRRMLRCAATGVMVLKSAPDADNVATKCRYGFAR